MMKTYLLTVFLLVSATHGSFSQTLKGTILDFDTEETLPGVTIFIDSLRASTDIDGNFEIRLEPNRSYSIRIEFSGLNLIELTNVKLPKGIEMNLGNIYMTPDYCIDAFVSDKHGNAVCKHFDMSKREKKQYLRKLNERYSAEGKEETFEVKARKTIQVIDLKRYLYDRLNSK